ncbi:MAG TPA: hypothetical protein VMV20_08830, partial [Chitinophagaceae bacterium]|nr:hypothetical protein [Chitinophagaceae bacterium]
MDFTEGEINGLVERYFEGETSLAEERRLEQYFTEAAVDPALAQLRPLFGYFRQERQAGVSPDFEARILEKVQKTMRPEPRVIPLKGRAWMSAAATALILLGSLWFYLEPRRQASPSTPLIASANRDTYQDPRQAMAVVEKALMAVSGNIHHGEQLTRENLSRL